MVANSKFSDLTPQDYLKWEAKQPIKYEYINGQIYAMTGGTLPHADIALNLATALKNHLRGKGCKVRMADAKVRISESGPYYYPDLVVTCDELDRQAIKFIEHPCLIIEVLSPTTEAFDRGDKFKHYRRLNSLTEYVLISADKINIDCYRLNDHGKWELTYNLDETSLENPESEIYFASVDFRLHISLLYEDVVISSEESEA